MVADNPVYLGVRELRKWSFLPAAVGFVIGGFFLVLLDHIVPHLHRGTACEEGPHTKRLKKSAKMFLAVTVHNIPEGLAVGFAFGAAAGGEQGGYIISDSSKTPS